MGKIKKILENELTGGTQSTEVYPVTSTKAVYDKNNERLDNIINRKSNEILNEVARATNAENNLRETINNITEINENATSANIVTIDNIPNTSSSNVQQALNELFKNATFAGIATPTTNPGTLDGPVFYLATEAGTYSNFNGISVADGEAVILQWNDGAWTKKTTELATEQEIIYDVSARNGGAVFESLQALLSSSNLSTLIPTSIRHGGMTIRFIQGSVQSSDNKYVLYRLMSNAWSTVVTDWQGVDDRPTAGSNNLVKSGGVDKKLVELDKKTIQCKSTNIPFVDNGAYANPANFYERGDYRAVKIECKEFDTFKINAVGSTVYYAVSVYNTNEEVIVRYETFDDVICIPHGGVVLCVNNKTVNDGYIIKLSNAVFDNFKKEYKKFIENYDFENFDVLKSICETYKHININVNTGLEVTLNNNHNTSVVTILFKEPNKCLASIRCITTLEDNSKKFDTFPLELNKRLYVIKLKNYDGIVNRNIDTIKSSIVKDGTIDAILFSVIEDKRIVDIEHTLANVKVQADKVEDINNKLTDTTNKTSINSNDIISIKGGLYNKSLVSDIESCGLRLLPSSNVEAEGFDCARYLLTAGHKYKVSIKGQYSPYAQLWVVSKTSDSDIIGERVLTGERISSGEDTVEVDCTNEDLWLFVNRSSTENNTSVIVAYDIQGILADATEYSTQYTNNAVKSLHNLFTYYEQKQIVAKANEYVSFITDYKHTILNINFGKPNTSFETIRCSTFELNGSSHWDNISIELGKTSYRIVLPKYDNVNYRNIDCPASQVLTDNIYDSELFLTFNEVNIQDMENHVTDIENDVEKLKTDNIVPSFKNNSYPYNEDSLKVLMIGNSITEDATTYLDEIVNGSIIDKSKLAFRALLIGGRTISQWIESYIDNTEIFRSRNIGELQDILISGTLKEFLQVNWDIVCLQGSSDDIMNREQLIIDLKKLLNIVKGNVPNQKCMIAYLLAHSWGHEGYTTQDQKLDEGYRNYCKSVKKIVAEIGIDYIDAHGTAIENLRRQTVVTQEHDFTRDGHHLCFGVGKYVGACCTFQSLIAPYFNVSVVGNSAIHPLTEQEKHIAGEYDDANGSNMYLGVDVTEENKEILQKCAFFACIDRFGVTEM